MTMPLNLTTIIGFASESAISDRLHALAHDGRVEQLILERGDTQRRRLRATTDRGTDCAVALPRDQQLSDGAVLALDDDRAIVVHMVEEHWLDLTPRDSASALELGYFAGNLHWRVRFAGDRIRIALEGPEADYLARLAPFLEDGRARRVDND